MNYIDFILITLLIIAALFGVWKGFVRQLFGLIALFLGLFCAFHFSDYVASYISRWIDANETAVAIISFAITFILVLWGVAFIGKMAETLTKMVALGLINRLVGLLFSIAKMAFILSVCIGLMQALDQIWPFFPHQDAAKSTLFVPISKLAPAVFPYLKDLFTHL